MSASIKRGSGATPSGKNAHRSKLVISKLETKDVLQLKSAATTRSDNNVTDQNDDASVIGSEFSTGKVFYENTYKLSPDAKMPAKKVETLAETILREQFVNDVYDSTKCKDKCQSVCQLIKDKVKELGPSRYKLVVVVHVGEKKSQGVQIASQCVWNDHFDNYVTAYFTNSTLFAQATVYALYVE